MEKEEQKRAESVSSYSIVGVIVGVLILCLTVLFVGLFLLNKDVVKVVNGDVQSGSQIISNSSINGNEEHKVRLPDGPSKLRGRRSVPQVGRGRDGIDGVPQESPGPSTTETIEEIGLVTCIDSRHPVRGPNEDGAPGRSPSDSVSASLQDNSRRRVERGIPGGGSYRCRRIFRVICKQNVLGSETGLPSGRSKRSAGSNSPGAQGEIRAEGLSELSGTGRYPSLPEGVTCDLPNIDIPARPGVPGGSNGCRRVPDIIC